MLERECGKGNPHSLLLELQTGTGTMGICVENTQKAKRKSTV